MATGKTNTEPTGTIKIIPETTTANNISFSSSSGSSTTANLTGQYTKYGKVVQFSVHVKITTQMTSGSGGRVVASVPSSVPRPVGTHAATCELNNKDAYYYSDSNLRIQNNSGSTLPANSEFDLVFCYLTNS